MRVRSLQAEILSGMVILMVAATSLLAVILVAYLLHQQEAQTSRLVSLLAPRLETEARAPGLQGLPMMEGVTWWELGAEDEIIRRTPGLKPPDAEALRLAQDARARGRAVYQVAYPWEPIRYALPLPAAGRVAIATISPSAPVILGLTPLSVAFIVLIGDILVFTAFGSYLIRRRVVWPLRSFSRASREMAEGGFETRLPAGATAEVAEASEAFNSMAESLQRRTEALEKLNADIRGANLELHHTKRGLERAERLAVVGRLSAGVAHEIGNPMGAMLALMDLVQRDGSLSDAGRERLERAMAQGVQVRIILRQLLDFSTPTRSEREPFDLADVARECSELVRAQRAYSGFEIEIEGAGDLPPVLGDRGETSQVILNLLLNAAEALAGSSEALESGVATPRISISLRAARWEERPELAAVEAVECVVSDSGPGIPVEDRERIFDPFYTTKPVGQGTGLGLANSLSLAERQLGKLECLSPEAGRGAMFLFGLPVAKG